MACSGHLIDPKHTDTAVDCFSETATIELGGGELTFEPFSVPVPEVIMVHGPQGGWHILGSILTQNIRQIVELDFDIFHLATGSQISDNTYRLAMVMEDECSGITLDCLGISILPSTLMVKMTLHRSYFQMTEWKW